MQNFRTLGLIIKKVRNLFNLSDKYGKIIQCVIKRIFFLEMSNKWQSESLVSDIFCRRLKKDIGTGVRNCFIE